MAALNINLYYKCDSCINADKYGRGCKQGALYPVVLMIAGARKCDCYQYKNKDKEL